MDIAREHRSQVLLPAQGQCQVFPTDGEAPEQRACVWEDLMYRWRLALALVERGCEEAKARGLEEAFQESGVVIPDRVPSLNSQPLVSCP
jgi:hypothetical protein